MKPCPNCEQPVNPGINLCPNCGADTRSLWTAPTDPGFVEVELSELTKRIRRDRSRRVQSGFVLTLVLGTITLPISFLTIPLLWFMSRSDPDFAKGCKWAGLTLLILIVGLFLGLLALCSGAH